MQREGQSAFAEALIRPEAEMPVGIVDPDGKPAPKRFAVYRNNVTVSLTEALLATFSATAALVGEEFFKEMARAFVRISPPENPLLMEYGVGFPEFVEKFERASSLPFLADIARIDRAWLDAFHEADAPTLDPAQLAGIGEAELLTLRFVAHPATRLVASTYPVVAIWTAGKTGKAAAGIDPELKQSALIARPDINVFVHPLTPDEGVFFSTLIDGAPLREAAEKAIEINAKFDLAKALGLMISSGAFTSISA